MDPQPPPCTWTKVTPSMITQTIADGAVTTISTDSSGGAAISVDANQGGCGNGNGSGATHIISGDWRKIRYTEHFDGTTSCWSIFGSCGYLYDAQCPNLIRLSPEDGDTITDIVDLEDVHLGGSKTQRCDNQADNFWHGASGSAGDASARVTLRRDDMTADAGLATGTSCTVTSSTYWHYTDIEVCL